MSVSGVVTMKFEELVAVPLGVVTVTGPVVAPVGTVARTYCDETVKLALAPLKATAVVCSIPIPLIITGVPAPPLVGPMDVIVGDAVVVVVLTVVVWVVDVVVVVGSPALADDTPHAAHTPTAASTIAATTLAKGLRPLNRTDRR